jgi:hypothetical protein
VASISRPALERRDGAIFDALRRLHPWDERDDITATCLEPIDDERAAWCQAVLGEVEGLDACSLEVIEKSAPHVWGQLKSEANEENETPEPTKFPHL